MIRSKLPNLLVATTLVLGLGAGSIGCSSDDNPAAPQAETKPLAAWVGDYDTGTKFGGAAGTWRDSTDLTIDASGEVRYGTSVIVDPTVDGNVLSWTRADGNAHNVTITFRTSHASDYYWKDMGGSVSGKLFTGSRQSAGEGPLDFRGLEDQD